MKLLLYISGITLFANMSFFSFLGNTFSDDSQKYTTELKKFMKNISGSDEELLDKFIASWDEDSLFSPSEQKDIIEISNLLAKKRVRPAPHFVNFLNCYLVFKSNNLEADNYDNWVKGMQALLQKRRINTSIINNALVNTINLIENNYLYKSTSTVWSISAPNFYFDVDDELIVHIYEGNLTCHAKRDSITIYNIDGTYRIARGEFVGCQALVTWERAGFPRNEVSAQLSEFTIQLKKSEFKAENVVFTNTNYFDEVLDGSLHHKVTQIKSPESASYPRFESYTKTFDLKNLYKDIDYHGGLAMHGAKLVGTGSRQNPATLYLYRNDTLRLTAKSQYIGFKSDKVASQRTVVAIKLQTDSIYHPDVVFNYRVENREVVLLKSDHFSSQGPYFNSYHAIDMNFEQLTWRMNENKMEMGPTKGSSVGRAEFESMNYFNMDHFLDLQMMDQNHPLLSLRAFSRAYGFETYPVEAYAAYLGMSVSSVKQLAMKMANEGFIFYDYNTEEITIKQRLHDYLSSAANRIDYDVINFGSEVQAPLKNAVFNLENNDLEINGIPYVHLSDSQNVRIYPAQSSITLKRNRNFQFDGKVEAGLLTFEGQNFFFSYDSFKINLQSIETIRIKYLSEKRDNYGFPIVESVTNEIKYVTGEILIDKDDNKSGRKSLPEYPIFVSRENSYVSYANKSIENGVYKSTDFYFELQPFTMDSLDNFSANSLNFEGEFVSAGIFPEFNKQLRIQKDNSLGFSHETPREGYPVYGGKGYFYNTITVSNDGLRGDGKLEYLNSTTWSENFIFHPDSMMTLANKFENRRTTTDPEYPMVESVNNDVLFFPYKDVMYVDKTNTNFSIINDTTYLSGLLTLEPSGLTGKGVMDLQSADLKSDLFTYKASEILSDTASFSLKSGIDKNLSLLTDNLNTHINYNQRKGWFRSNDDFSLFTFPVNKYVSYIDAFQWDFRKYEIAMGNLAARADTADEDTEPFGPRYISIHHEQDSLNFVSPLAIYKYNTNTIDAKYVKFIDVADARIYPKDQNVLIGPDANMHRMRKSRIKANRYTQYHNVHTASVKIQGRLDYYGSGYYDYVDENEEIHLIHFGNIEVTKEQTTFGEGYITDSADFPLSPVYEYKGKVFLYADRPLLTYHGGVLIEHNCNKLKSQWVYFESEIDPQEIYIPIAEQPLNYERNRIYSNLSVYYDSIHIYPSFFTNRKYHSDLPLVEASGFLYYDKVQQRYKIGSKEKINDFTLPEPYINMHRESCMLYNEGPINLGAKLGQVKLTCYGNARHNVNQNITELNMLMGVDFFIDESAITHVGQLIDSLPGLDPIDLRDNNLVKNMKFLVGTEPYKAMMDEMNLFGTVKELPAEMNQTLILSKLKLVWNDETNSYQSEGRIGLASINGIQINKMVDGFVELRLKRSGDIFDIYL
ncbi:MAG: hypothetical protein MI922_05805, partial [Bacteroidales bacterium]|nr:hypothetical protein [Bacteroidales bacterium]